MKEELRKDIKVVRGGDGESVETVGGDIRSKLVVKALRDDRA
jgi:hypothetical protein